MLQVNHLSVTYDQKVRALEDVSFEVANGQIIGVMGPNGAGKSSLIKGMLDLVPSTGEVLFNDCDIKKQRANVAYVEQKSNIDLDFPITVFETVLLGTYPKLGLMKRPGNKEKEAARAALKKVEMLDYADRQISQLSGGQFQRILIARALVQEADLIFLDEPFVGIDITSESLIIEVLRQLKAQGKTLLIVHHDMNTVEAYFDSLILINKKLIAEGSVHDVFTEDNIVEAYGASPLMQVVGGDVE